MVEAAFWGGIAASSLLLGALVAYVVAPSTRSVGIVMAFGAGTLLSAVSFEMIGRSIQSGDTDGIVAGMLCGSVVYWFGDWSLAKLGAHHRGRVQEESPSGPALGIVLGTVLDGIPESFVLGITLAVEGTVSAAFLAAVFISNVPEAIASTVGLKGRWSTVAIYSGWGAMVAVSSLMSGFGYVVVQSGHGTSGARIEAFAAGAILTMLATTMMPEAFKESGRVVGVVTVLGYILALTLTAVD